ncbi:MAG: enterobactin exporter EntS [Methanomassiliicoccales archaeon PtaB.Bin134]|jgi:DHA3 family macrolide efflux protein-like MFS transporter|nr:MAG: enterobactin exporter EntS [Methanomassiliicoccales archaeon PtaB.Bin134]
MNRRAAGERSWKRDFFTIWGGQAFSLVGSSLVQFALVWWLTVETGSATILALGTLMGVLPQIIIAPWAGAYVDRWNRRRTMIAADTGVALMAMVLMMAFAAGIAEVWMVLLAMFGRAAVSGFHWPAMQAATSMMVPERHLGRVGGINQAMMGLSSVVAAPAGAVLIALFPMWAVLSVDIITALMAIVPLLFIPVPEPRRRAEVKPSLSSEMREGLAFIRGWQGALSVIVLFMIANLLLSPAFSLLPLLVIDHFQGGAGEYAAMEALAGIGMLAGGLFLGVWGGSRRKMSTMLASCLALSIGVTALGLVPMDLILAAYAIAAAIGITLALLNGSFMAMLQAKVPFDKQGRVFALISAGVTAMMPAGLLLAGPLADLLGVRAWYLIAGVPMALLTVVFMAMPSVTRIEERVVAERQIAAEE